MKKLYLFLALGLLYFNVLAQPEATSFTVNGLKVIFKPTLKETISVSMFYRGGVTNYSPAQAGLENLALLAATTCGTRNYKENAYREMADEFGIDIGARSEYDYGAITMDCVTDYFDQGWSLFSEAVLNPTFKQKPFTLQRDKVISAIRGQGSRPKNRLDQIAMELAFAQTPYAKEPLGEEAIIQKFTADSVKNYYNRQLLNKNRMFLVVAGKIKKEELEQKIKDSFAALPAQPYKPFVYASSLFQDQQLVTEERELATNYLCGLINAPPMASPDFPAFLLSIRALSGRIFQEVRLKQNLSYDPGATLSVRQVPHATLYASTTNPKATLQIIATEYLRMKKSEVSAPLLDLLKKDFKQGYYHRQESSSSLVESLGEAEIMGGWQLEEEMVSKVNQVTTKEMYEAFQKYTKGIRWAFLGNKQLAQEAFQ